LNSVIFPATYFLIALELHLITWNKVMSRLRTGKFVLLAALWTVAGCYTKPAAPQQQTAQPEVKVAPATPIAKQKEELGKPAWDPQWDVIVETALPPELLSSRVAHDVKPFCPRFNAMSEVDRRAYWAYFFQALAGVEAGLIPTEDVRHTQPEVAIKDPVTKRMARSEGLLQLAYMDADRYGCDFDWDRDKQLAEKDPDKTILQPKNNLTCGVKILDRQLIDKRKPLVSRSSYWSTLQPGTESYRLFVKQMANVPSECRTSPLKEAKAKPAGGASRSVAAGTAAAAGTN
jgi:hypothetical protein